MYGPTSKQLDKVKINWDVKETIDEEGYYEDGERDAKKGRASIVNHITIKENQEAYLRGYYENVT